MARSKIRVFDVSEFQRGNLDGWRFAEMPKTLPVQLPHGKAEMQLASLDGDRYHYAISDPDFETLLEINRFEPYIHFGKEEPLQALMLCFRIAAPKAPKV